MSNTIRISTPLGTSGIAVEPWSKGEIYAVAANWAQASSPIMLFGRGGWEATQYQVADFRHRQRDALAMITREAIEMGGDDPGDDEVGAIVDRAVEIDDESSTED